MTHFIRFPDEATGMAYLRGAGLIWLDEDDTEHFFTTSHIHALDVIGEIPDIDGWHVNYVGSLPEGWADYIVTPEQPVRVFF